VNKSRWVTRETVPPGFWRRNQSTLLGAIFFGPISPSYVDSEFGAPPRVERIVVDGYLYSSVPPPAKEPSAAEVAATEKELRDHHERVVLRRWRKTILPALLKKQQRFRELDLPSLTDGGLLEHIHELSPGPW
jgi:hypothetical protein